MKRTLSTIAACILAGVCAVWALEYDLKTLSVTTGTNATAEVTADLTTVRGQVWEIKLDAVTALTTGTVSVVAIPAGDTDYANVTLVSAASLTTAGLIVRPRFDATDAAAAALTGDPPEPFISVGTLCGLQSQMGAQPARFSNVGSRF
jgi:hypothetical protein